jgi:hypothetical protein
MKLNFHIVDIMIIFMLSCPFIYYSYFNKNNLCIYHLRVSLMVVNIIEIIRVINMALILIINKH